MHCSCSLPAIYPRQQGRLRNFRRWETVRVGFVYLALLACFIVPVNQGIAGLVLSVVAALIAPQSARTWVTFIVASQIVPDPKVSPLTVAELGVCGWLIVRGWRLPRASISLAGRFLRLCAPLCLWMGICVAVDRLVPPYLISVWTGVIVGAITVSYAPIERDFVRRASEGLVIGSSVVVAAYMLVLRGVAVVTTTATVWKPGSSEVVRRIGFGRGDINMTATTGAVFVVGIVAWWVAYSRRTVLSTIFAIATLVMGATLVMDTYGRAGMYMYVVGVAAVAILARVARVPLRPSFPAMVTSALLVMAAIVVAHGAVLNALSNYWQQIQYRDRQNVVYYGGSEGGALTGRAYVWLAHARILLDHPITGVKKGDVVDLGPSGIIEIGEEGSWYEAHNDILEMGSWCGIPGALLFLCLLVWIPVRVLHKKLRSVQIPALALYITYLMVIMSFTRGGDKTLWASAAILFASAMMQRTPLNFVYLYSVRDGIARYIPATRKYVLINSTDANAYNNDRYASRYSR